MPRTKCTTKTTKKATKVANKPNQIAKAEKPKQKCGKKPRDLSKAMEETDLKKSVITIKHAYLHTFAIRLYPKNKGLERLKIPKEHQESPHGLWLRSKLKCLQN